MAKNKNEMKKKEKIKKKKQKNNLPVEKPKAPIFKAATLSGLSLNEYSNLLKDIDVIRPEKDFFIHTRIEKGSMVKIEARNRAATITNESFLNGFMRVQGWYKKFKIEYQE